MELPTNDQEEDFHPTMEDQDTTAMRDRSEDNYYHDDADGGNDAVDDGAASGGEEMGLNPRAPFHTDDAEQQLHHQDEYHDPTTGVQDTTVDGSSAQQETEQMMGQEDADGFAAATDDPGDDANDVYARAHSQDDQDAIALVQEESQNIVVWGEKLIEAMVTYQKDMQEKRASYAHILQHEEEEARRLDEMEPDIQDVTQSVLGQATAPVSFASRDAATSSSQDRYE